LQRDVPAVDAIIGTHPPRHLGGYKSVEQSMPFMRLAFLTHEPFYPPSGGGSAEAVYLVQELVRRGHEVHLFCPAFPEIDSIRKNFSITIHPFTTWPMGRYARFRNFKYLAYPFCLRRLVERAARDAKFDVILSQHAISAVAAGHVGQRLRVPVVMNFLDYLTGFMETWPRYLAPRGIIRGLERYELSLPNRYGAAAVLTVSDTLADYFAGTGFPRDRILPIYYGYDAERFPLSTAAEASEPDSPVIVMHGSFDRHHLGPIALEAVEVVMKAKPRALFRFVGRVTPALAQFRLATTKAVPCAQIECTDFVPYAEIAGRLSDASVGIVPYEESTGTHCAFVAKIVEYLGVGLPVVSTPLNSARRYFGNEAAVRFSEFDGASFGRQILSWLDEPFETRRRLGKAASDRVRRELDWGAICKKAVDFVEKIALQQGRN
jgi:glycosyltransferase involved in cell wall biosynthesis